MDALSGCNGACGLGVGPATANRVALKVGSSEPFADCPCHTTLSLYWVTYDDLGQTTACLEPL